MQLLGAFTDGDLRRSLQRRGAEALSLPLSAVMTAGPRTCSSDLKAVDAMQVRSQQPACTPFELLTAADNDVNVVYYSACLCCVSWGTQARRTHLLWSVVILPSVFVLCCAGNGDAQQGDLSAGCR